jgi:CheY-like chemotaxis protein
MQTPQPEERPTARPRVLFVDDDHYVLSAIRRTLWTIAERCELCFAATADEVAAHERHGPFDVVVADRRMPDLDGLDLVRKLKAASPRTVCLLLSGTESQIEEPALHRLLAKPCSPAELLQAVTDALNAAETGSGARP